MAAWEALRVALESLWANKMRAMLTMLGVIIGVFSVLIMVALVQGLRQQFLDQFAGNGADLIFAAYDPKPDSLGRGGFSGLTVADINAIRTRCTLISSVSPEASTRVQAQAGRARKSLTLSGVGADFPETDAVTLARGRFLTAADEQTWSKACVVGAKVRVSLFGASNPIGQPVLCSVNGSTVALIVVGVLGEKDRGNDDYNNTIYLPLGSLQKRFTGSTQIDSFAARARHVMGVETAADQVWSVLKQRHPLNVQDFVVDTQEGLITKVSGFLLILQLVLGGIAGLALLTGGIGIMNIMLVSVTERTREIGIRKAVGASRGSILLQFIIEAMVVSGLGGLLGIGAGYGVSALVDSVQTKILMFVPLWAVGLGFGFAVGVGLFFGIYPAFRAARLDPITALRYE